MTRQYLYIGPGKRTPISEQELVFVSDLSAFTTEIDLPNPKFSLKKIPEIMPLQFVKTIYDGV